MKKRYYKKFLSMAMDRIGELENKVDRLENDIEGQQGLRKHCAHLEEERIELIRKVNKLELEKIKRKKDETL